MALSLKASKYNYSLRTDDGCAVLNTRTGKMLLLSDEEYACIRNGKIDSFDENKTGLLIKTGFLVDAQENETALVERLVYNSSNTPLHFRILTTTACNAKCSYCYENGTRLLTMTEKTGVRLAEFIKERYCEADNKGITLEWFGGEPCQNTDAISNICRSLDDFQISYMSTMYTNGLLLDKSAIKKATSLWRMKQVQISLDGAYKKYDAAKCLPSGSYERVLNNVHMLLDAGIYTKLRINYCKNNTDTEELLQDLGKRFRAHNGKLNVYISPLYEKLSEYPRALMMELIKFSSILSETGLSGEDALYSFQPRYSCCFACSKSGFTVMPDGVLLNCSHNMTEKNHVGSIWSYNAKNEGRIAFIERKLSERCRECVLLPQCLGGCRMAELGLAEMNQCIAYKSVYDQLLLKRYLRTAKSLA